MEERILERIRKLFAKADNNSSEEEAQLSMLKAQELLFKYGYSMADLEQKTSVDVVEENVRIIGKQVPAYKEMLTMVISKNFRVTPIYRMTNGRKKLVLIGLEDDVAVCLEVCYFSFIEFENLQKKFIKQWESEHAELKIVLGNYKSVVNAIKNDYLGGFTKGLSSKFKSQVEEQSLCLYNPKAVVEYVSALGLRKGSARQMSTSGNQEAFGAGYNDGKSLDFSKGKNRLEETFS